MLHRYTDDEENSEELTRTDELQSPSRVPVKFIHNGLFIWEILINIISWDGLLFIIL
jgi:hypothetical protein